MNLDIQSLLDAYRNNVTTPDDVISYVLEQCDKYQSHNVWITRLSREVINRYLDSLRQYSIDKKPLYGIPFAIKDNIDLEGMPTTAGCEDFKYLPEHSATVVSKLIEAGAIPIGKTNMDQFATGLVGTRSPESWGVCKNSHNPEYISGGSSSGSAVAVALGLVSFSLGTDTAGSGRVPAAFNNIVGLKPTRGIISNLGVVPACKSLDCVSIFALTTDDANLVLENSATYDGNDIYSRDNPYGNNTRHYGLNSSEFTFGVPKNDQLEFFGDESARELYKQSVEAMQRLGGKKVEIDFECFLNAAKLLYEGPWVAERYIAIEQLINKKPESLLPVIREIVGASVNLSAMDAFKAMYQLQNLKKQTDKVLDSVDFILTPTTGTIYTIDEVDSNPIQLNSRLGYYTNYLNLLDYSAIAMPAGFLENGLPWGITLVASAFKDRQLLGYANQWQQNLNLLPGKSLSPVPETTASGVTGSDHIPLVVCGAHMTGLPLNWQLSERHAKLVEMTKTSTNYRMYALPGGPPYRPGLIRDAEHGRAFDVEIWRVPAHEFGSFVEAIPAPLAIGKVELADGQWCPGFVCESYGIEGSDEITEFHSWREYMDNMSDSG